MQYELSKQEAQHIEKYRNLLPEFQKALDKQAKVLYDLQTHLIRESIKDSQ